MDVAPPRTAESTSAAPVTPPSRWGVVAVTLIAVLWGAFLIGLAVTTSNPTTLNQRQLRLADVVLVGRVTDLAAEQVEVVSVLHGVSSGQRVRVRNLGGTNARQGETYLFPLTLMRQGAAGEEYLITPSEELSPEGQPVRNPDRLPLPGTVLLPATEEVEAKVKGIFEPAPGNAAL